MAKSGFYQNGFDFFFEWPVELSPGVSINVEMRAFVEPDECVGCTDWYLANVYVADTDQEITRDQPLAQTIIARVQRKHDREITERWKEWLSDRPRKRTRSVA